MTALEAHVRGYAFEKFLSDLFDAYGLDPKTLPLERRADRRAAFQFNNETYLVEAKWHGKPIGVAELHTCHGKIEQKVFIASCSVSNPVTAALYLSVNMV